MNPCEVDNHAPKEVFHSSEAGDCIRALCAIRLGHQPLPRTPSAETVLREAKRHERWVIEDLRAEGYTITADGERWEDQQEYRYSYGPVTLVIHPDGLL